MRGVAHPEPPRRSTAANDHDGYLRDAVRVRTQHAATKSGYRVHHWYCDGVVRLLPLRPSSRADFRQAVLSQFGSADGDARRLRNLFHRLCRAPDRRRDLRPLRRPHRPQGHADCNAVVHGHRHVPDRLRSDIRNDRNLGRGYPDGAAYASGHRRLLRISERAPFYIFTAFIFAYAVGTLHMSRNLILGAVLAASLVSFVTIPLSGHISDRIGRKKMYLIGAATTGVFGFLYFGMVDSAAPLAVFVAIVLSLIPHDMQYGPQAALIAEAFTPSLRYSGACLGDQLASVIAGRPAPLIATALFASYHSVDALSIYIAACAVLSLVASAMLPDYTGR